MLQDITGLLLMLQLVSILSYIFVIWVQGSIQMCPHCRLNIEYCCGLRTWIFCRNPWTDADQTFTIRTPLLNHSIRGGVAAVLATHEAMPPPLPSLLAWTGMLSGQSTDQTMRGCDTKLKLPCCNVYCICWTARWRLFDVQFSSVLPVSIVWCANQPYSSK